MIVEKEQGKDGGDTGQNNTTRTSRPSSPSKKKKMGTPPAAPHLAVALARKVVEQQAVAAKKRKMEEVVYA